MAGSLLPVGKAVLRSSEPSKCYMFNADLQHPKSIPILPPYKKRVKQNNTLNKSVLLSPLVCQYRLKPVSALDSDVPYPIEQSSEGLKSSESLQWDSLTAKFAGAANIPFLILQLSQIILNARNLLAGNQAALFAVPWLVWHSASIVATYSCGLINVER
uniref:Uncharacterized protein n=1 Tax=Solanum lycopersicum TaxID=4081 RepID=A0A3Q7FIC3_SOLLC